MIFGWGPERKTWYFDHDACVRKVERYLRRKYGEADRERELVEDRRTDAFGYNKNTKTWYVCEIKVDPTDLLKAPFQIMDTAFRFRKKKPFHNVTPVIAIPAPLHRRIQRQDIWRSLSEQCRQNNTELWIIESGAVRELQTVGAVARKPKVEKAKVVKPKPAKAKTPKAKVTKRKTTVRKKTKVTKAKTTKAKPTKRKTTTGKRTKSTVAKPKRIKTTKAKVPKRKTTTSKSTKSRVARTTTTKAKTAKAKAIKKK